MTRFGSDDGHEQLARIIDAELSGYGLRIVRADWKQFHDELWANVCHYMEAYSKGILEFIPGFDPNSTGGGKTFSRKFLAKAACRIGRRPE